MARRRDDAQGSGAPPWIAAETVTGEPEPDERPAAAEPRPSPLPEPPSSTEHTLRTRVPEPALAAQDTLIGEELADERASGADPWGNSPSTATQDISLDEVDEVDEFDEVEGDDGDDLADPAHYFQVSTADIEVNEPLEVPLIAAATEARSDDTEPVSAAQVARLARADATPFAVATDEILLEEVLDSRDLEGADLEGGDREAQATSTDFHVAPDAGFQDEGYWEDRISALREQQKLARNTRKEGALLLELAEIYEQRLHERDEAVACYERLQELEPDSERAFDALDRLYPLLWEVDKQIELLLDRQERVASLEDKAGLLARVAELYLQTGDRDKAELVLDAALDLAPGHPAVTAANRSLAAIPTNPGAAAEPPPAPTGAAAPPPPPADPATQLQERLVAAIADDERVELLDQLATVWLQRDEPQRAAECLHEALGIDRRRESAYRRLEQLYRKHERYADLVQTLELHAQVVAAERRIEILRQLADLYEGPIADRAQALATYERLRDLAPDDAATLRALLRHHEQSGDAQALLGVLRDASHRLPRGERVELLFRQGALLAEQLGDPWGAEEHYQQALEIDATHAPSIAALTEIYRQRGDWGKAVRMMLAAEAASSAPAQRARYLYDAAQTRLLRLEDESGAAELFARTLEVDPDHQDAAEALAAILYTQGDYQRLAPVLDVLVRKTDRQDIPRLVDLNYKLGSVAEQLGDLEAASHHLRKAAELDPGHHPTLLALGAIAFGREDFRLAQECYSRLQSRLDALGTEDARLVLLRLARSAVGLGSPAQARSCYERLLERHPQDADALAALAELQVANKDWHGAIANKEALLAKTEGEEAAKLLLEIGDLCREQLRDAERAEAAYRRALLAKEDDRVLLHRLLDLYSDTKQWESTLEICERLAAKEKEPAVRAKYLGVAASLCEKQLDREDDALRFYNLVLDVNHDELKAFSAIDAICTKRRDWRALEQNYGKMLKRLPKDGKVELKAMLWHNLGEVLRSRRRDFESAIAAFEVAQKLDPKNMVRRQILAELYLTCGPDHVDKAITSYHQLLAEKPRQVEYYDTLRRLYQQAGQYDRAWCLAAALCFIQKADRETQDLHRRYRARSAPMAQARLTDDAWRRFLYHGDQDPYLTAIFGLLAPPLAAMTARPHSAFGLKRKERYDYLAQQDHPFCHMLAYVQSVLHLPTFDLFLRPDQPSSLQLAHTSEATSLVAGAHVVAQERSDKELLFLIGKQLAFLRPELFLRLALPARAQLQGALLAAIKLVNPNAPLPPGEEKNMTRSIERLRKHFPLPQLEQLGGLLARLANPERVDLGGWWNGVELTTDRAGFVLCNDLETAARMIAAEPSVGTLSARDRTEQLLRYAVSEPYFKLRRELAITIEQTA